MEELDREGLNVQGQLDLEDSATAREVWRSMKNGAMSLSIGFMVTQDHKREDGIRELHGIDLFEISVVPHPANADTRVIEMKSERPIRIASFEC
jgi:HK97 family phage prohead protease